MTVEAGLLFAAISCAIAAAGFFRGRQSAAKKDGERWGKLDANMEHMREGISRIELSLENNAKETKESFERVYDRMEERFAEHLKHDHGMS